MIKINYALGIDVGGTSIKYGVIDNNGEVAVKYSMPLDPSETGLSVLKRISQQINELKKQYHLKGIGIGMPGILDLSKGSLLLSATTLNSWQGFSITKTLKDLTHLPVKMSNDANVAALAEAKFGKYKNARSLVLITLGTGIGGGIVIDHKIIEGEKGQGAELGHISIDYHGRQCGCGRRGCLEAYASATALANDATRVFKRRMDAKMVWDLAKENNATAKKLINNYIAYLGEGLLNYCIIFRPKIILLSGGVANAGLDLLNPLKEYLKAHQYGIKGTNEVKLDIGSLKYDSGIIGAASLIL